MARAATKRRVRIGRWIVRRSNIRRKLVAGVEPCREKRKGCPVQLVFREGKTYLRFCVARRKPGPLVEVRSPRDAVRKAQKACKCWEKSGDMKACAPRWKEIG